MKEVYGTAAYNKSIQHNWVTAAERCNYMQVPEQGTNECGFYTLKIACTFDGNRIVETIKKKDVNTFKPCTFFFFKYPCTFFSV